MSFENGPGIIHKPPEFKGHRLGRGVELHNGQLMRPEGNRIDLHALLTNHSHSIHLLPIHTNNMRASGLIHGGIAVVDRAAAPKLGALVVVRFNGDVVMRRLERREGRFCFVSDDPREEVLFVAGAEVERMGNITWSLFQI